MCTLHGRREKQEIQLGRQQWSGALDKAQKMEEGSVGYGRIPLVFKFDIDGPAG